MKAFRLFAILIVLSLLMVAVKSANAEAPVPWTSEVSGTETLDCGSFIMGHDYEVYFEGINFFDKDGNIIRSWSKNHFYDRFYNLSNGKEATGSGSLPLITWPDGSWRNGGLSFHIVIPGEGTVLIDAGYILQSEPGAPWIFHGIHMYFEEGDFSKLCAALE